MAYDEGAPLPRIVFAFAAGDKDLAWANASSKLLAERMIAVRQDTLVQRFGCVGDPGVVKVVKDARVNARPNVDRHERPPFAAQPIILALSIRRLILCGGRSPWCSQWSVVSGH